MRLYMRDAVASLFVALAAVVVIAWALAAPLPGLGEVRAVALVVLVLGIAASVSAVVPGFSDLLHGSRPYLAAASALGVVALAAAAWAIVGGERNGLVALALATLALWGMSTVRHIERAQSGPRPVHRAG